MKRVLLCGATGAIGQAAARTLAAAGWSLYLQGWQHMARIHDLVRELQIRYPQQEFLPLQADFSVADPVTPIKDNLFGVDAVVFSQGITDYELFVDAPADVLDRLWQVNVRSPLLITQSLQEKLAQTGHGRIVYLGSVYGGQGSAMEAIYSMTKGALSAFAQAYAREVASLGITVNVIAPGAVDTPMNAAMLAGAAREELTTEIPAGRLAAPQDVAYWLRVLLAPEAQYLTGQTIYVSGGWLV
ncbi:elongation factor P 5-aminopentanone reductase [Schleiferilactobacillus perolens]|jgi:3-oxoacyl-[acyl-carrier protein] reductase|uniref:elongation factor P 5-aminopentanone reductase n=1 Tax=Schleiferilactobacillus perolens TaxID=100468 RepID=UPI002353565D|nr:SDR family oxidoreductase [Schleiferilactobacillus perolens]MCI1892652.1 SDR family oxidoreductase [Schleiferilactobacillus harbinensis]MCI2170253.1 SDR family oxidoreductase [Schleiferilactobacillus perolens]